MSSASTRDAQIVRTSAVGIAANVALAALKAVVGLGTRSIAIALDAVNNLSDAMSSIITIVGTRLAAKQPDRDHPFGHGRAEYITTIVIAAIVLWAGATSLWESVQSILSSEKASYDAASLVIVGVAVAAKLVLGAYFRRRGRELASGSLVASGEDATMDAAISAATLVAAVANILWGVAAEPWLGAAISVLIVKTGIDILREALSKILGERVDAELARAVKDAVCSVDGVRGAYDLVLTDYGPERLMGSIHVEVDEDLTARDIDALTRAVQARVASDCGVALHTVGIYSTNAHEDGGIVSDISSELAAIVREEPDVLQTHGLYVDTRSREAAFDVVVGFEALDREAVRRSVLRRLEERFPGYSFSSTLDVDTSD